MRNGPIEPSMFGFRPNIVGESKYLSAVLTEDPYVSGALKTQLRNAGVNPGGGDGFRQTIVTLDASTGNEIYSGSKLQTSALQILVCIKI